MFTNIHDRRGQSFLSVRDLNTFDESLRKKRLMTLVHLFLIHRYKASTVHYVSPTDEVRYQTGRMKHYGIFSEVHNEIGHMIVASVNADRVAELLQPDRVALKKADRQDRPAFRVALVEKAGIEPCRSENTKPVMAREFGFYRLKANGFPRR